MTRNELDGGGAITASAGCAFECEHVGRIAHDFTGSNGAYRPVLADVAKNRCGAQWSDRRHSIGS
jgi:hypothetical protein